MAVKICHPLGTTALTTGKHAYGSASEKSASSYGSGDACKNRVERACPKPAPGRRRETTKPNPILSLPASVQKFNTPIHMCQPKIRMHSGCPPFSKTCHWKYMCTCSSHVLVGLPILVLRLSEWLFEKMRVTTLNISTLHGFLY